MCNIYIYAHTHTYGMCVFCVCVCVCRYIFNVGMTGYLCVCKYIYICAFVGTCTYIDIFECFQLSGCFWELACHPFPRKGFKPALTNHVSQARVKGYCRAGMEPLGITPGPCCPPPTALPSSPPWQPPAPPNSQKLRSRLWSA